MMLTNSDFEKICQFIYRKTGIFIEERKFSILSKKIDKKITELGFENFREFFHSIRFAKSNELIQELINVFTVNETYFFRENYQFDVLVNKVLYDLHEIKKQEDSFRILCAPSSTGEEAYSIALHLLAEGNIINLRDIEIVGIDIDSEVINKAKKGIYSLRSVQMLPPKLLREFFKKIDGDNYQIADFLREVIDFKVVNIMDKIDMKNLGKFDVIFSRNMLIYFDDASKREASVNFYEILNHKGFLFLGHADNINRATALFTTQKYADTLVYKKA